MAAKAGEWKAWDTGRRCHLSRGSSAARKASRSASGPETVKQFGALTAASTTWPPVAAKAASRSAKGANTAAMPPVAGSAWIRRPRSAERCSAVSKGSTPAAQAAASSPMLCPATAAGRTPQDRHSSVRAYWMAKITGWVTAVWARAAGVMSSAYSSSIRGRPRVVPSSPAQRSRAARNTGWVAYSSRPMPTYCEPWPLNRNTMPWLPRVSPGGQGRRSARAWRISAADPRAANRNRWGTRRAAVWQRSARSSGACSSRC